MVCYYIFVVPYYTVRTSWTYRAINKYIHRAQNTTQYNILHHAFSRFSVERYYYAILYCTILCDTTPCTYCSVRTSLARSSQFLRALPLPLAPCLRKERKKRKEKKLSVSYVYVRRCCIWCMIFIDDVTMYQWWKTLHCVRSTMWYVMRFHGTCCVCVGRTHTATESSCHRATESSCHTATESSCHTATPSKPLLHPHTHAPYLIQYLCGISRLPLPRSTAIHDRFVLFE
jgi:hypothetical protein